jgi:ribose transport system ATP-binding protein
VSGNGQAHAPLSEDTGAATHVLDAPAGDVVLSATGIRKTFGGVTALDGVDFAIRRGEVHGLIGQNGAGKSTLVKVLNGVHQPDAGELHLDGRAVSFGSPMDAKRAGIAMVFQEFSLIPTLTVAHNVFLGHEPRTALGLTDEGGARRRTREILDGLGVAIDADAIVGELPVGSQQLVEIAKATSWAPSILILDEPTASLSQTEVATLFRVLRTLRDRGVAVVYISHHLQEVLDVCDGITVLRDGRVRLRGRASEVSLGAIVTAITGHEVATVAERTRVPDRSGVPVLELRHWGLASRLVDVSLSVHPGEVLGIAGLLGSGRTSLLRSIAGLEPGARGELLVGGQPHRFGSPADAFAAGIAYVPEDRRREGIIAGQTVEANLLLAVWSRLVQHFLLSDSVAEGQARALIDRLGIRTSGPSQLIEHLSGGNQQKVVVGRSLAARPRLLLLDDPTAGIDVGSRRDLLAHVRRFADDGGGVLLVSSELDELAGVADRVMLLDRGSLTRTFDRAAGDPVDEATLLRAIAEASIQQVAREARPGSPA